MATTLRQQKIISEKIVNNAPRTFTEADFPIGTVVIQGDLYMVRIAKLPTSAMPRKDRQLAQGNTQGSRHILEHGRAFDCDPDEIAASISGVCKTGDINRQYLGPVFQTVKDKADLTHPEHGNHKYRGDMTIAVVYQRNMDSEEREQRVQD
jgi:hypothetical protein